MLFVSAAAADASTERQNLLVHLLDAVKQVRVKLLSVYNFYGTMGLCKRGGATV